jgi:NHL repeat
VRRTRRAVSTGGARRRGIGILVALSCTLAALSLTVADAAAPKHKRGTLNTVAGIGLGGRPGSSGDGGPGGKARLRLPKAVTADSHGNVYITDFSSNRVRKVDKHGKISTFAGTGRKGFSGDGGPATRARLFSPWGVAVDSHDNVYIADYRNLRIRKVDARTGTISTFAGNGHGTSYSDPDGDGGPATEAPIDAPWALTIDSHDNLYLTAICSVRKVDTNGIISTLVAPIHDGAKPYLCGYAGDHGPSIKARIGVIQDLAADSKGNLYLADPGNHRVRKVAVNGIITTFAGTGKGGYSGDGRKATKAKIYWPIGVAVDGKDNVYIAVGGGAHHSSHVRKVNQRGIISTVAGSGKLGPLARNGDRARKIPYWGPERLWITREGDLLTADGTSRRVWVIYGLAAPFR